VILELLLTAYFSSLKFNCGTSKYGNGRRKRTVKTVQVSPRKNTSCGPNMGHYKQTKVKE